MPELKINNNSGNQYSKEYTLIQYTEHIHFQAEEPGACLRASEVKPKLDNFIHKYLKKIRCKLPENWYLSQTEAGQREKTALNYQMQIWTTGQNKEVREPNARQTAYFGNMGDGALRRNSIKYRDPLRLKLYSPIEEKVTIDGKDQSILELIDDVISAFFALTCFGTRSTKGFGSYGIEGFSLEDKENQKLLLRFVNVYYLIIISENQALSVIKTISNMMKAGINFRGYYKGRIFRYFTINNIGSDKAFMKQKILPGHLDTDSRSESRPSYSNFLYTRALLGLAPQYEFRAGHNTTRSGTVTVEDPKGEIGRFNNPIHFIPNGTRLVILPTEIPDVMFNREFVMTIESPTGHKNPKGHKTSANIFTPKKSGFGGFDLIDFMDYFMNEFNSHSDMGDEAPIEIQRMDRKRITRVPSLPNTQRRG